MSKQKNLAELNAEKEKIEQQLAQEQHKKQRLENRIAYYEKEDRRKRAHTLSPVVQPSRVLHRWQRS